MHKNAYLYSLLICFSLLCCGTLFAVSDCFVNARLLPKWYAFSYCIPAIIILFTLFNWRTTRFGICIPARYFYLILTTCCLAQAMYGILQYCHLFTAYGSHRVTGSFDNPTSLTASLCAGVAFAIYLIRDKRPLVRCYSIAATIITVVCVVLSFSRAGIISLLAIFAAIGLGKINWKNNAKVIIGIAALFLILLGTLYFLKKDSADGRLLIWRCSVEMIKDKPLLGHGSGGFTAHYMNYQAAYFEQNPDSRFALLADNIHHPFNEYLLLTVNYGLAGLLLFCVLACWVWREYRRRYRRDLSVRAAGWSLLAVAIFALFSYPLSYPFVWVVVLMSVATIFRKRFVWNRWVKCSAIVVSAAVMFLAFADMRNELRWARASDRAWIGGASEYDCLYQKFASNRFFLYNYAYELEMAGEHGHALGIANECRLLWADYYLELLMAESCQNLHRYSEAEVHLKQASAMCPNRFMPLYELVNVYDSINRPDMAIKLAKEVVDKPVKVPSATISVIKKRMQKRIEQ